MNTNMNMKLTDLMSGNTKKNVWIALGAVGSVAAVGVAAVALWNSKQMRTSRAIKRTGKVLYRVGSAMRDMSGMGD